MILISCYTGKQNLHDKSILHQFQSFRIQRTFLNCNNIAVFFGVDSGLLQHQLPVGMVPYMKPFFPGIKKGQATIIISFIKAESSDFSNALQQMVHILAFINAPKLPNEKDTTLFKIEAYELARFTDFDIENNNLPALGFKVSKSRIASFSLRQDTGYSFHLSVKDSSNELFIIKGAANKAVTFNPTNLRFWQSNENVIAYLNFQFPVHHSFVGSKGQVVLRPNFYLTNLLGLKSNDTLFAGTEYIDNVAWVKESLNYTPRRK